MAINKKLIHFKNYADFNSKKLSANEANTQYTLGVDGAVTSGSPDVLYQSICWIKDVKKMWTHGTLYDCGSDVYLWQPALLDSPAGTISADEISSIESAYLVVVDLIDVKTAFSIVQNTDQTLTLQSYLETSSGAIGVALFEIDKANLSWEFMTVAGTYYASVSDMELRNISAVDTGEALDDVVASNSIYVWEIDSESGTVTQDQIDSIKNADVLIVAIGTAKIPGYIIAESDESLDIKTCNEALGSVVMDMHILIDKNSLTYILENPANYTIPTATSELTNDSGFITESSLNDYATISYVDEQLGDVNTALEVIISGGEIKFYLLDKTWTAKYGMTWAEWIDSEYCTDSDFSYYNDSDYQSVQYDTIGIAELVGNAYNYVKPEDKIVNNQTYYRI